MKRSLLHREWSKDIKGQRINLEKTTQIADLQY